MKIFRDPIHNVINLDTGDKTVNDLLISLIDSREFQRLRFIKQMGLAYLAYPSATHTRFEHSLGVAYLAKRFLDRAPHVNKNLTIIAALLHDIGHGPLSHVCEIISGLNHETQTRKIILGDTEVNALLKRFDKDCPQAVCDILNSSEIISGQLDVDRMDYLLRDSHMTGSGYGRFDLEWLLHTLTIDKNGCVTVEPKGQSAAEDFETARKYMYKNVYHHKTVAAAEAMLVQLVRSSDQLKKVFLSGDKNTDIDVYYTLKQLAESGDSLAYGLLYRRLKI